MVAPACLNTRNQGTETVKYFSESQVSFNSWSPITSLQMPEGQPSDLVVTDSH